jgi:F-type H+-transporting ATPase subunit epsilon
MANLTHAELITPERVLFSGDAEAVVMRTDGGDITFLANHMDYIGAVDICVVRIEGAQRAASSDTVPPSASGADPAGEGAARGGEESTSGGQTAGRQVRAAVHGGFVMVADNKVTIAAAVAELADEIDVSRAQRALEATQAAAGGAASVPGAPGAPAGTGGPSDGERAEAHVGVAEAAAARARVRLEAAAELKAELSRI